MSPAEITALMGAVVPPPAAGEPVDASVFNDAMARQAGATEAPRGRLSTGQALAVRPQNLTRIGQMRGGVTDFIEAGEIPEVPGGETPLVRPTTVGETKATGETPLVRPTAEDGKPETALVRPEGPETPIILPTEGEAKPDVAQVRPDTGGGKALEVALTLPGEAALAEGAAQAAQAVVAAGPEITPMTAPEHETAPAIDLTASVTADASPATPAAQSTTSTGMTQGASDATLAADLAKPDAAVAKAADAANADVPADPAGAQPDTRAEPAAAPAATPQNHVARADAPLAQRLSFDAITQISAQILRKLEGRTTRFDMELNPTDLGRVDVRLDIDSEGRLAARLAFDNPAAATDLRGRVDDLRRQLEDAGFQLAQDAFSFADREETRREGGDFGGRRQLIAAAVRGAEATDLAAQPTLRASLRGGLDVRI